MLSTSIIWNIFSEIVTSSSLFSDSSTSTDFFAADQPIAIPTPTPTASTAVITNPAATMSLFRRFL
jgi:hypothetical protein